MKIPLFLLSLIICMSLAKAQSTFSKIYDGGTSFRFNLTEMPDNNIMVGLGRTRAVSHVDIDGSVTYTHSYWAHPSANLSGLGGIRRYFNDEYIIVAHYTKDSCTTSS